MEVKLRLHLHLLVVWLPWRLVEVKVLLWCELWLLVLFAGFLFVKLKVNRGVNVKLRCHSVDLLVSESVQV